MRMTIRGIAKLEDNTIMYPMTISEYPKDRTHWVCFFNDPEDWDRQKSEPVKLLEVGKYADAGPFVCWAFRDYVISVETVPMRPEDVTISIKHFILKKQDKFQKMKRDIERFERFERFDKLHPVSREEIPEEVRMYVWRRDEGKCVQCGSNRNLEFDHIIPVSEGGGSTERNIQLMCSPCNKKKSNKV